MRDRRERSDRNLGAVAVLSAAAVAVGGYITIGDFLAGDFGPGQIAVAAVTSAMSVVFVVAVVAALVRR